MPFSSKIKSFRNIKTNIFINQNSIKLSKKNIQKINYTKIENTVYKIRVKCANFLQPKKIFLIR